MDAGTLAIMAYLHSLLKREEGLRAVQRLQIIYIKCDYNTSLNYKRPNTVLQLQRLLKVGRYGTNTSATSAIKAFSSYLMGILLRGLQLTHNPPDWTAQPV
jgi:hypothetical protein